MKHQMEQNTVEVDGLKSKPGEYSAKEIVFPILLAISFSHFLNDSIQSLLPAIYPLLKNSLSLKFAQVGLITLTFQLSASVFQPFVGLYTDRKPLPLLACCRHGIDACGFGVLVLRAASFPMVIFAAALVGTGSAVFHPEASRLGAWLPADGMDSRSLFFRLAAIREVPSGLCWRRSLSFRTDNRVSSGSRWLPSPVSSCSRGLEKL